MNDGRKSKRRDVRHGAWIFVGADSPLIPCMLLDVSATGARLKLDANAHVPADFILVLSRDKRLNRRCRMVWREDGQVGARFTTTQSLTAKAGPGPSIDLEAIKTPAQPKGKAAAASAAPQPAPAGGQD